MVKQYNNTAKEQHILPIVWGAHNFAVYDTFIETYKQVRVSFHDSLYKYLWRIIKRKDYENLPPMFIYSKKH